MFKFFWRRSASLRSDENPYPQDPLSHPAIASMSSRQIADLPFDPYAFGNTESTSGSPVRDGWGSHRGVSSRSDLRRFRNS